MPAQVLPHAFVGLPHGLCDVCRLSARHSVHLAHLNEQLARTLFERAQDGYVNPTGGKTTGRERKEA